MNGHSVQIYASIEELPIVRFHKYNKCLLVDAGVGSDLNAFDTHIERVVRFIRADKREDAAKELENMRQDNPHASIMELFDEWEYGVGFGADIWPSLHEFLTCEEYLTPGLD